jgi:hypothetical protein
MRQAAIAMVACAFVGVPTAAAATRAEAPWVDRDAQLPALLVKEMKQRGGAIHIVSGHPRSSARRALCSLFGRKAGCRRKGARPDIYLISFRDPGPETNLPLAWLIIRHDLLLPPMFPCPGARPDRHFAYVISARTGEPFEGFGW